MTLIPNTQITQENVVETEVQYEVWGDGPQGDFCAGSDSLSDAMHYAAVYGQDDPVIIKVATTTRVPYRPALSPPAEGEVSHPTGNAVQDALIAGFLHGVGRAAWDDMHDYIAVCAVDYAKGKALPERATPTPAPVDWERIGPKLVEALEAVELARLSDTRKDWTRATKLTDAALAAAHSQSNGE